MSLINCNSGCVYQQEGLCSLEQAASGGISTNLAVLNEVGCIHYVPKMAGHTVKTKKNQKK